MSSPSLLWRGREGEKLDSREEGEGEEGSGKQALLPPTLILKKSNPPRQPGKKGKKKNTPPEGKERKCSVASAGPKER